MAFRPAPLAGSGWDGAQSQRSVAKDEEDDDVTDLTARALDAARAKGTERSPDAIFRSFVANAYEDAGAGPIASPIIELSAEDITRTATRPQPRPVPSANASLRNSAAWDDWAADVEEVLDGEEAESGEDEPTMVAGVPAPRRPVVEPADDPEERRDTEPPPSRPTPREPMVRRDLLEESRKKPRPAPEEGTLRVVLLTKKKPGAVRDDGPLDDEAIDRGAVRLTDALSTQKLVPAASVEDGPEWTSVVRPPSASTQRREALKLVPDVANLEAPLPPPVEGSEDGMMPGGELDRKLGDMAVLLRYGHEEQVRRELDHLMAEFPRDLLLLRRISEFWVAHHKPDHACDALFTLASGLFERRNMEGMRQALEQVLLLSPGNERATRLLTLLAERPAPPTRS